MIANKNDNSSLDMSTNFCRLCYDTPEVLVDIFKQAVGDEKETLKERMELLFQITFEKNEYIPSEICEECIDKINNFMSYRQTIVDREKDLKSRAKCIDLLLNYDLTKRAGLNGNPGEFEPLPDEDIIEIDPDQDFDTTDDEFSMESDVDNELVTKRTQKTKEQKNKEPIETIESMETNEAKETNTSNAISIIQNEAVDDASDTFKMPPPPSLFQFDFAPKNTYLCQYCDMAFTTALDCTNHESTHNPAEPYACSHCVFRFLNRQQLIMHIRDIHDPDRPYICALCNKGFCRRSDLKKHTIVHTGVRPFTCHICGKNFSRNTNLTKHMRIHSSMRPFVCQRCPRSFASATELVRHARTHAQVKPYKCSRCNSTFTRKDKLHIHEQGHDRRDNSNLSLNQDNNMNNSVTLPSVPQYAVDLKDVLLNSTQTTTVGNISMPPPPPPPPLPLQISLSSVSPTKKARSRKNTKPAPKTSNVRIFICSTCSRTFKRERDLNRHKALHMDSLYKCTHCPSSFGRPEKLAAHIEENHNTNFTCEKCNLSFACLTLLDSHRERHERQEDMARLQALSTNYASGNTLLDSVTTLNAAGNNATTVPNTPIATGFDAAASLGNNTLFLSKVMNLGFYNERRPTTD